MQEAGQMGKAAQRKMMETSPAPRIPFGLTFYTDAFFALSTERQYPNGVATAIPISKIIDYGTYLGVDDLEQFVKLIQVIDYAYISHSNDRLESQRKLAETNAKRK